MAPSYLGAIFLSKRLLLLCLLLPIQAQAFPWFINTENIRGAQLMSPEERKNHLARLQAMQRFDECRTYMQGHYLMLDKRAKEQNVSLPPVKADPCEAMRLMGRIR